MRRKKMSKKRARACKFGMRADGKCRKRRKSRR